MSRAASGVTLNRVVISVGVALLAGAADMARAQTASATLAGTVRTADRAPVEGVVVEARSSATGVTRAATTGKDGRYRIELLQPGTWSVSARRGDETLGDPRVITLSLQQTGVVDFMAGPVATETVSVGAEAPLVDRSRIQSE